MTLTKKIAAATTALVATAGLAQAQVGGLVLVEEAHRRSAARARQLDPGACPSVPAVHRNLNQRRQREAVAQAHSQRGSEQQTSSTHVAQAQGRRARVESGGGGRVDTFPLVAWLSERRPACWHLPAPKKTA